MVVSVYGGQSISRRFSEGSPRVLARRKYRMHPKKPHALFLYMCGTSLFFIVFGIVLLCLWALLYDFIVSSSLVLKPNSAAYNVWKKNPVPLSLKLYLFNWTNPEEVYNSSVKPRFEQLGPYTFIETKEKTNITWNANDTVSFKHLKTWWFDEENSQGSLNDPVTSIAPVSLSAAHSARNWNYFVKKGLSISLGTMINSIAVTRSAGEVLFDGYEDPLLTMAMKLPMLADSGAPAMDKFGWFYGRNASEDFEGSFNMDAGVSGQLGELYEWKYWNHTPYYQGECGSLKGASAGEFFPSNLTKENPIKFFSADLCRFVELEFDEEVLVNGIVGYKYSAQDRFLDNGTKVVENKCFCDGDCMPSGALNVSACRYGSPAFVSLPHFFKADPYYRECVDGLDPKPEKNDFYMVFEPKTGIPIQVAARLQLNLLLQPVSGISLYENVPKAYFPVLWFEQAMTLPAGMAFNIKILLNFKVICWAIAIIMIVTGVLIEICLWYKICTMNLFGKKKTRDVKEEVPLNQ